MLVIEGIGNLGNDAVIKNINGKDYVSFDFAHAEGSGDRKEITWVSVLWYGTGGNLRQILTKGRQVFVRGRMQARVYTSKDGAAKVSVSCFANEVSLCGGRNDSQQPAGQGGYQQTHAPARPTAGYPQQGAVALDDDSDLPDFLR